MKKMAKAKIDINKITVGTRLRHMAYSRGKIVRVVKAVLPDGRFLLDSGARTTKVSRNTIEREYELES